MVARYHHLAIWFAQFGHDLTLTSQRAMRRWENAERDRSRENLGCKSLDANLGAQNLGAQNLGANVSVRSQR
jgi:hypothetical protein